MKKGMRLAQPIYNHRGVLLFERDSKLTVQSIESVKHFGLLGVYVLDPAEPLPPMSQEEIEFERFQIMAIFSIQEELDKILKEGKQSRLQSIAGMIIKNYGRLEDKLTFHQSLRSRENYVFKHSLNVASFCAMMGNRLSLPMEEMQSLVLAAILHDIGKVSLAQEWIDSDEMTKEGRAKLLAAQHKGLEAIEKIYPDGPIRRLCFHLENTCRRAAGEDISLGKQTLSSKILAVANRYDEMTAMHLGNSNDSEVAAIRELQNEPKLYDADAVAALIDSVNILFPGVSVELSHGKRALVIGENSKDILRPTVLVFENNQIMDLSLAANRHIYVKDVVKTLDNRYVMSEVDLSAKLDKA